MKLIRLDLKVKIIINCSAVGYVYNFTRARIMQNFFAYVLL